MDANERLIEKEVEDSVTKQESDKAWMQVELLSHKEVAKVTILNLEEARLLQKQQHLSSTKTTKKFLKNMDEILSVREGSIVISSL